MAAERSPIAARISLGLLALALLGIFAAINVRSQHRLDQLRNEGLRTVGTVSAKRCSNHGEVTYSFSVEGKPFTGGGMCTTDCDHVAFGTPVDVLYARSDPGNSECVPLSDRQGLITGYYVGLVLVGLVLGVVIMRITSPGYSPRP